MPSVILVVDDNESGRYVLARTLQHQGFTVKEAATGEEALARAKEHPDLILLDVNLPDVNGLEVCKKIKSDPGTRNIPVLHISATAVSEEHRARGLEGGADGYLVQPIDPGLLSATVKALLRARRAESELLQAGREWQLTFDSISHGLCLIDKQGRITRANRAFAEMSGKSLPDVLGKPFHEVYNIPEPAEGWPFLRAMRTGHRETAEIETPDKCLFISVDPLRTENGELAGGIKTVLDITARKRVEREKEALTRQLEFTRSRLEQVLKQMPMGVLLADAPSGAIVLANELAAKIFRSSTVPGNGLESYTKWKLIHADGRDYTAEEWPLARAILNGEFISDEEIRIQRGDGTRGWIRVSAAPIKNQDGYVIAGVMAFYDVTERRALEDQFRQSQKMEAMGRLAGGVAHDFNNLLTIIGGYSQMIMEMLDKDEPLRKDVEPILESAERATQLTRQLLTFSRRQTLQPKSLDINRLVTKMNRILKRVIGEDVQFQTSLTPHLKRVKADPGQIEQVIVNLAVNARDAMPQGGSLTIATFMREVGLDSPERLHVKPGAYVVLSVSDTGTGMSEEVVSHIFEPFFTTKPKGKGTGLGLSTVYGIVKQTGGEILVHSAVGKGTTFEVYLPVAGDQPKTVEQPKPVEPALHGAETILLVEDEPDVRRLTRQMLARQGYDVLEAGSGPEALKVWEKHGDSIHLLLTDVIMPQMSGRELADKLTKLRPGLKVLFMSGYTDDVISSHGVTSGSESFLPKPFTHDVLGRKVRDVLDRGR